MKNGLDILRERGFIEQTVFEDDLYKLLGTESVPFYVGFDPTADSLHIGHYIPVMAMAHLQRAGHKPIALVGGGTAMVGDPSYRTDMRQMMSRETIKNNVEAFIKQLSHFISFEGKNAARIVNNADWLLSLNYIDFLRDIGVYFSVNKMLTAECFKTRMEKGLSFLEFNYMLMQGYDFLVLYQKYGVKLQVGGNDQWANILAGADLIRRKEQKDAFAMTFKLLLNSDGTKMGKTAKGTLWLDKNRTPVGDFYQYFRNVEDGKVAECMRLLTFMELSEIAELTKYRDERMNAAKEKLAYEVTCIVHGKDAADSAQAEARAAFGGSSGDMAAVPCAAALDMSVAEVLTIVGMAESRGEAKRLIQGGGVSIDDKKVTDIAAILKDFTTEKEFILQKGKKVKTKYRLNT